MKKLKFIIIVLTGLLLSISFFLLFFKQNSFLNKEEYSEEKKMTLELLERIPNQKSFSDPLGIFNENGEEIIATDVTKSDSKEAVTKYEILKDINGNNVKVKLKKQLITESNGQSYEAWIIEEPVQGRIKYYLGELIDVNEKEIKFMVNRESEEMDLYTKSLVYEDVKDYIKIIKLEEFLSKESKAAFIPPDEIYIGFKIMKTAEDFYNYLNKKIYLQETVLTYYKNSPHSKRLFFSEYI